MINLTTTIQEITIQAYSFGVYDYLFNREHNDMSRDQILNLFEEWGKEFEEIEKAHEEDNDWYYYDEIDEFVNKKYTQLKMEHALQYGIAIGDYITYEGGTYKISGFTDRGILVDEVKPGKNPGWIVTEIALSQHDKIKVLSDYEEVMDTTNNHDTELVKKINDAWNTKREKFAPILIALYKRDIDEIVASDAFADWGRVRTNYGTPYEYMEENWDIEAPNYLQHIADDGDLKVILDFIR